MLALVLSFAAMSLAQSGTAAPVNPMAATAMRCSAVTAAMGGGQVSPITLSAQAGYFMMAAAHADPADKSLMDRTGDMSDHIVDYMVPAGDRPGLLASCQRDYPQAYRATMSGKLPGDSFTRDTMCLGAVGIMFGSAQAMEKASGDSTYVNKYKPLLDKLGTRLTDDLLQKRGLKTDADYQRYMGEQLYASLSLGNAEAVADACLKLPG